MQKEQNVPSAPQAQSRKQHRPQQKKLAKLPPNAKIHKRPLHHPAIPSPYTSSTQQKIVYVSARTPFISAVKRVDKLLRLADKRLVQAATTLAKEEQRRKRKRDGDEDEVMGIAKAVERLKRDGNQNSKRRRLGGDVNEDDGEDGGAEEVWIKGTGKAVRRVMEMGLWFQQREEYAVRLRTGSVGAIDDVEVEGAEAEAEAESEAGNVETEKRDVVEQAKDPVLVPVPVPETRIRYVSVLEVAVSLR
ncbi:hypothetical protein BAUCODRAFT_425308 [Baudoinia panamericana UAMH 10762]|uniref:Uncharacterized protein n=1 Tax=Baudoinia panamericana (strain UAMH 10762) TaxID=717646 RepID=M2MNY7_BAUPA|nr:uncharacterized protein BAUCODRAFT_425308 [Baudoinia panamericana UAMH 10762]EMC98411.1 hypothetical protein BAUCODRAFT_425308 [Baudoinia panamericana UAMH 10762]